MALKWEVKKTVNDDNITSHKHTYNSSGQPTSPHNKNKRTILIYQNIVKPTFNGTLL
jgi:hypothetical protein